MCILLLYGLYTATAWFICVYYYCMVYMCILLLYGLYVYTTTVWFVYYYCMVYMCILLLYQDHWQSVRCVVAR